MFKLLKQKLAKSVRSGKLNVFLLFLLLSFSVLLFTKLSQTYRNSLIVEIDPRDIPENQILQVDSLPKIELTYSDYGFKIIYHNFKKHKFPVELQKNVSKTSRSYSWKSNQNNNQIKAFLGKTAENISVKPDSIKLPFDTLNVVKVPVLLQSKFKYEMGYDALDSIVISPDSIKLIGAESKIREIKSVNSEELVMTNVKNDIAETVGLKVPEGYEGIKFKPENVQVTMRVGKFTEGEIEVPVIVNNVPNAVELNYFPKKIKVVYYVSLQDYKSVKVSDFRIDCNFNEAQKQGRSFFIPQLHIKNDIVKSAKMKQDKVEYIIVK